LGDYAPVNPVNTPMLMHTLQQN